MELTKTALVVWDGPLQDDEIVAVEALSVLGHLSVNDVFEADPGESGSVAIVDESCEGGCICPQDRSPWFRRDHVIFSDEVRERFGAQLVEVELELCDTPTSRLWAEDTQALQMTEFQ